MNKVTFDGCGINDTDEYASRLATCTERGRPFGDDMARAINTHTDLLITLDVSRDALIHAHQMAQELSRVYMHSGILLCNCIIAKAFRRVLDAIESAE
jgi:hypothetical protein